MQNPLEADFLLTKKLLTSPLIVKPFNTKPHTILLTTDASRLQGLGFALMQKLDNYDKLSLIMCGSKSLIDTQANYATLELAILYTCQKYDFYLRGLPHFEVQMYHKTLEGVFKRQMHSMENARLLRMREKW